MKRLAFTQSASKYLASTHRPVFAGTLLAAACLLAGPLGPVAAPAAQAGSQFHHKTSGAFHGKSFFKKHRGFSRFGSSLHGRSFHRSSFGFSRRSVHRGGFKTSFSGPASCGVAYTAPRSRVLFGREFDRGPHTVVIPAPAVPAARVYPAAAAAPVGLDDAWRLLEAGRFAMAQNAFARIATAGPGQPEPKVGYGLAAVFNGSHTLGESAFLRAHRIDPAVWERLGARAAVRAAATDLRSDAGVQASQVLNEAVRRLAGPAEPEAEAHDYEPAEPGAGHQPTPQT